MERVAPRARFKSFASWANAVAFGAAFLSLPGCGERAAAPDDLIAQIRQGSVMCVRPSSDGKRCNTIVRYSLAPDGQVRAQTDVTMSASIVMSSASTSVIRNRELCQSSGDVEIDTATFQIGGRPATTQETDALRKRVKSNIASRPVQDLCMTVAIRNGKLMVDVSINGTARPEMSEPMIWIHDGNGYIAGPA